MKELKEIILKLINIGGFRYEWSFHKITFNITENYNKNELKKAIETYISWLKIIYTEFKYIYTHEISGVLNINLMLNKIVKQEIKENLLKDWNKYNNWAWYNKKGILIKNKNEYDAIIKNNELVWELPSYTNYIANKTIENVIIVFNYMFKDLADVSKIFELKYILYPLNLVGGRIDTNDTIDIIINEFNNLYTKVILNIVKDSNLKHTFLNNIPEENKLKSVFNSWILQFEYSEKLLLNLLNNINVNKSIDEKQEIIENYLKQKVNNWDEIKLYNMRNEDLKLLNDNIILKLNNKINIKIEQYALILELENINNTIYYLLEGLVQVVRYFKKEYRATEIEEYEFSYTESYFKTIIREMYITNIIHKNLKNVDKKNKNELICQFIKGNQTPQEFYKEHQKKIESELALWIDLLIEILYELNIIEKISTISIYHKDHRQNYFTLSNKFLNYLIFEEYTYDIIPPVLKQPKEYEDINKIFIGGYYTIPNLLFSENANLDYKLSLKNLKIINESQKISLRINVKYLNYLLNSDIKTIEQWTGLCLQNYNDNYINATIKDIKKVPDIFLIHEFFLTLYIAIKFQNEDIWFISKIDERGRKYDIGYPLNFYRDKILRNLFIWNKDIIESNINASFNEKIKNYTIYANYFNKIKEKEKEYNLYNIIESPLECLVGFDATNQIFQIIGGILKDIKLLELSKVIKLNTYNKQDIYEYFLNELKTMLYTKKELNDRLSRLNNKQKKESGYEKLNVSIYDLFDKLNRDWIKKILMTYGYNKSVIGLIEYTTKYLLESCFQYVRKITTTSYYIKKEVNVISTIIIKELLLKFNKEFITLKNLKLIFNSLNIISKLIKHSVYIAYNEKENGGFHQYYLKMEYVTFLKWRLKEKTDKGKSTWVRVRVTYPAIKDYELKKLDFRKNINALLPNTCHYLDALLMYNILKDLILQNIPIKTIHDAFYTNIKYKEEITSTYIKNYIKIFKTDVLEQIIKNALNEFCIINEFFDLIVQLNKNYNQNILSECILQWKLFTKKELFNIKLDTVKLKMHECLLKIQSNYKKIHDNGLMHIDLEEFILKNKNEEIII